MFAPVSYNQQLLYYYSVSENTYTSYPIVNAGQNCNEMKWDWLSTMKRQSLEFMPEKIWELHVTRFFSIKVP